MSLLPPKPSMASYTLGVLRQLLAEGEWKERLPGERALAMRIGVSRPTLHEALLALEKEGALRRRAKAAWQILRPAADVRRGPRKVLFLSPYRLEDFEPFALHQFTVLSSHLAERGHETEAVRLPASDKLGADRSLAALARQRRPDAWVLYRCSPATQRWFAQSGLPAVVMGSAPGDLRLRSVDVDYRAAGRHAVATLLRLGHRPERITYLMPAEKLVGHAEAAAGMAEALGPGDRPVRVVTMPATTAAQGKALDALWQGRPPTALVVHRPLQSLTILTHLAQRGVAIPARVSLILLDDNPVVSRLVPEPSRYQKDIGQFSAQLRRCLEQAMAGRTSAPRGVRIMPELARGGTLAPPPEEAT